MKQLKAIKDKVMFAYLLFAAVMLVILIGSAFIQVVTRYILEHPPGWTDELARFTFIWCSALGSVVALDKGLHAGITLLEEKLPEKGRNILKVVCCVLVLAMSFLVGIKGITLVGVTHTVLSTAMQIPMSLINVSICFCSFGMALVSIVQIFDYIGNKNIPNEEKTIKEGVDTK